MQPLLWPLCKSTSQIDKLLEEHPNIKVKIIFTTPNLPQHPSYKLVSHLLAIAGESNIENITMKALDDWYLPDKKDYEFFAAKHPMNGELAKQGDKMEEMDKWCKEMEIHATPTIFINGYKLPDAYNIENLQYFFLE